MAWSAFVAISQGEGDLVHVVLHTKGDDNHEALTGAAKVAGLLSEGREMAVRAVPQASSERDHETGLMMHRGFARFTLTGLPERADDAA